MIRLTTSPSQNTGTDTPSNPNPVTRASAPRPRQAAPTTPIHSPADNQITAAPPANHSVTGAARSTAGTTSSPRLTKLGRSRVQNSRRISTAY